MKEVSWLAGDKIRFTPVAPPKDGEKRISNGRLDELKGFDRERKSRLERVATVVDQAYGHVDFGYVITSHASQGKDRDVAMAAMGSNRFRRSTRSSST